MAEEDKSEHDKNDEDDQEAIVKVIVLEIGRYYVISLLTKNKCENRWD